MAGELVEFGSGVFPFAALFNHSCHPHAQWRPLSSGSAIAVRSLRAIRTGEEVYVSYLPLSTIGAKRVKSLRETHGFVCHCERCTAPRGSPIFEQERRELGLVCDVAPPDVDAAASSRPVLTIRANLLDPPPLTGHLLLPDNPYDEATAYRCRIPSCGCVLTAAEAKARVQGVMTRFKGLHAYVTNTQTSADDETDGDVVDEKAVVGCSVARAAEAEARKVLGPHHTEWCAWISPANVLADQAGDIDLLCAAHVQHESTLVPYRPEDVDVIVRINHALIEGLDTIAGAELVIHAHLLDRIWSGAGVDGFVQRWVPRDLGIEDLVCAILAPLNKLHAANAHADQLAEPAVMRTPTTLPPAADVVVDTVEIRVGMHAQLRGLKARADLNGKLVSVQSYNAESGRWHVHILEGDEALAVKPEALIIKNSVVPPAALPASLHAIVPMSAAVPTPAVAPTPATTPSAARGRPPVFVHLDPCLLPDDDDPLRWRVMRECEGFWGGSSRSAHPAEMMTFELSGRDTFEATGTPPPALVALRRLIVVLILASEDELRRHLEGETVDCWAIDPSVAPRGGVSDERRMLELQAVGGIVDMICDLTIALLDSADKAIGAALPTADAIENRAATRAELFGWKNALRTAHQFNDDISLDSLLDELGVGDGDTTGELQLPLSRLMKGVAADERHQPRLRFHALIVRQLLAKYDLDERTGHGVQRIEAVVREASAAEPTNAVAVATARILERFHTSREDALALASYFGGGAPGVISEPLQQTLMSVITERLLRLPDAAVEATEVSVIPQLLSSEEIQSVFAAAEALSGVRMPSASAGVLDASTYPHHVKFGGSHVALFLHRDHHFTTACPTLADKLVLAMRTQPNMYFSPQIPLHVRVVELHSYTRGDGLMVEGHRDQGSIVTMSILLSETSGFEGGSFTTCKRGGMAAHGDGGTHVTHRVACGDAIVFHSEKMHNVTPMTSGVRHALVLELWLKPANVRDRHS